MHFLEFGHAEAYLLDEKNQTIFRVHLGLELSYYVGTSAVALEIGLAVSKPRIAKFARKKPLQLVDLQFFFYDPFTLKAIFAGVSCTAELNLGLKILVLFVVVDVDIVSLKHTKIGNLTMQQA